MPINANVTNEQISVAVGETQIDVTVNGGVGPAGTTSWDGITDKPATFTPSAHVHEAGDITSGTLDQARLPYQVVYPVRVLHVGGILSFNNGAAIVSPTYFWGGTFGDLRVLATIDYPATSGAVSVQDSVTKYQTDNPGRTLTYAALEVALVDAAGRIVGWGTTSTTNAAGTTNGTAGTSMTVSVLAFPSVPNSWVLGGLTVAGAPSLELQPYTAYRRVSSRYIDIDQTDWANIPNKPSFSTVATSGSYNDLANKPTIPAAYTLPNATTTTLGGVIVGSGLSVSSGTVSANVTSVAGRTGAVTLAVADVSGAVGTTDARLSDTRTPTDGSVTTAKLADASVTVAKVSATGTPSASTFLAGNGSWATPSASITYATTAQAQDGTLTNVVMSPRQGRDQLLGWQTLPINSATVANGGAFTTQPANGMLGSIYAALSTTTTTSGTVVGVQSTPANAYNFSSLYNGQNVSAKNWSLPQSLHVRIWRQSGSTNSVFRVQWGEKSTITAFAQLSGRGIGFELRNLRLWILAHNGTSLTQFDTGIDTPGNLGNNFEIVLRSDGAGNVSVLYSSNGSSSSASTSGGPTTTGSGTSSLTSELTNGTDATACVFQHSQPRITNQ